MTHLVDSAFDRHAMQRISAWLARACLLLIVGLPLLVASYWAVADPGLLAVRGKMLPLKQPPKVGRAPVNTSFTT